MHVQFQCASLAWCSPCLHNPPYGKFLKIHLNWCKQDPKIPTVTHSPEIYKRSHGTNNHYTWVVYATDDISPPNWQPVFKSRKLSCLLFNHEYSVGHKVVCVKLYVTSHGLIELVSSTRTSLKGRASHRVCFTGRNELLKYRCDSEIDLNCFLKTLIYRWILLSTTLLQNMSENVC